jgi:hypothetical protein
VERLSGARAAAALLRNAFILDPRPEVAARALAVAAELGEAVPAWRLGFTVSADAARAVGTLLGAAPRDGAGPPRAQEPAC